MTVADSMAPCGLFITIFVISNQNENFTFLFSCQMHSNYSRSLYAIRTLVKSKPGIPIDQPRVIGTPFDVPGQIRQPTPINVPSSSRDNGNDISESEANTDDNYHYEVNKRSADSKVTSDQDDITVTEFFMEKENVATDDLSDSQSEGLSINSKKTTQTASLQHSSSPRVILSFTIDPSNPTDKNNLDMLKSLDNATGVDHLPPSLSNHITTENDTTDDHSESSSKKHAPPNRKTASKRSNPSDNESESTLGYSEELAKKTTKRRKSSSSAASVASTTTDGSGISSMTKKRKLPKPRKPNNKKRVKPWEDDPEEEIPHDDAVVTIAELCKDIKRGRKSTTFKELELAKYHKAQQRRAKRLKLNNPEEETTSSTQKDLSSNNNDDGEPQERNTDEEANNESNDKPILMKRRVFANRGSRFINDNGQYTVREDPKERRNTFNAEGMEVIEEDKFSHIVNSHSYAKRPRKNERWTNEETELFYRSLSQWGTDFEIIAQKSFHNTKTRGQIKNKYKRERKTNPERVNDALDTRIPINIEELNIQIVEEIDESATTFVTDSANENLERNEDQGDGNQGFDTSSSNAEDYYDDEVADMVEMD
ncbi:10254_t:CDS:2 [Acaulospora morrowiae]|uniref:10254_t:CDS:1 n=1 Tax=Acaulospora morrowiae TaxID=94023 RepID=A0A9N8VIQ7_9GLOM|nr:10254_t:CDS:2 [Acaulospora morrowiae]